jgi:uncharacterized protein YxjI
MRFVMRESIISIGGDAAITDEQGHEVYFVDGKALALMRKLELKDTNGHVLTTIHRRIGLRPTFEIDQNEKTAARVVKSWLTIVVDRFTIDMPGQENIEARGDILQHNYSISRGGRTIAQISKAWIALSDVYGIDIAEGEDMPLLLSIAVAIDEITDRGRHD